jgi:hypothetical protein
VPAAPGRGTAQSVTGKTRQTGAIFYTENDDWPPDTGTDKDYTNRFRLTIDRNSDPLKLHRWPLFRGCRTTLRATRRRPWTRCASVHTAIGPVAARADEPRPGPFEAFISVDGRGSLVGYNAFLDAANRHDLTRRKAMADVGVGVGLRVGSFMLTYRVATISKEYDEALTHHEFKALRFMYVVR